MNWKFWKRENGNGLGHEEFMRAAELEAYVEKGSREYEAVKPVATHNMDRILKEHYANNWGRLMRETLEIRG